MSFDDEETLPPLASQPQKEDRNTLRGYMIVFVVLLIVAICFALSGCASERFLTEEQDANIGKQCEQGCRIVPLHLWREIENFFRQLMPSPSVQKG